MDVNTLETLGKEKNVFLRITAGETNDFASEVEK